MFTPWGQSDSETKIAEGIIEVSTPSHGGIWLSQERQNQLPQGIDNFNHDLTWWEEDCDWVVPYIVFQDDIKAYGKAYKFEENLITAYNIGSHYHKFIKDMMPKIKGGNNERNYGRTRTG